MSGRPEPALGDHRRSSANEAVRLQRTASLALVAARRRSGRSDPAAMALVAASVADASALLHDLDIPIATAATDG